MFPLSKDILIEKTIGEYTFHFVPPIGQYEDLIWEIFSENISDNAKTIQQKIEIKAKLLSFLSQVIKKITSPYNTEVADLPFKWAFDLCLWYVELANLTVDELKN